MFLYLAILFFTVPFLVSLILSRVRLRSYFAYPLSTILVLALPAILIFFDLMPIEGLILTLTMAFFIPLLMLTQYLANLVFENKKVKKNIT
ncbi:hypothetical protein C8E01_1304 [Pontibacter virosus]|uniref:Uncharacterized protein n=1 Tax=Pontibacter virosus TaxID=1765052 RepID=A0A2U1AI02_9BACT|nr:hypothetical protein C8E01_1304 [Pontibacter virosus]